MKIPKDVFSKIAKRRELKKHLAHLLAADDILEIYPWRDPYKPFVNIVAGKAIEQLILRSRIS